MLWVDNSTLHKTLLSSEQAVPQVFALQKELSLQHETCTDHQGCTNSFAGNVDTTSPW